MVYPAAWVQIPLAPPVAGSLPDNLRGMGYPSARNENAQWHTSPLGIPTWNISTDGQCLQLITETTKVQIFYVPPALRTCRKGLKPFLVIYRSKKNHRSVWQHRSRTNLPPNHPAGQPCSSTALRSYPSAYPSRLGSLILANQFNRSGMIFFFGVSPLTAFHIPGKVPGTYRHRLYGLPRIPLPGHTRKIEFPKVMSTYKFSLCRLELVVCRDFIFLILFRMCSLLLYTQQQLASLSTDFIRQTCQAHTSGYIQKQEIVPENDSSHT